MHTVFIGGGNMASALIAGLISQGADPGQIGVVERNTETRARLLNKWPVHAWPELTQDALAAETIVLAVKPQHLKLVAQQLAPMLDQQLILSIAAGVRTAVISNWLDDHPAVVRAMPNTPAMVNAGITGLYAGEAVTLAQRAQADRVLHAVGVTLWLPEESMLDAITAVSGSGPGYVFYFMEAMQQAAMELGLSAEAARQLTRATFSGAAKLAEHSTEELSVLREQVTSPGGTTECALLSMRSADVSGAIGRAILAAASRSKELGDALA